MLHKKCLNGMFIFRSLKNRLRVYANIWFTLLEIKEHVFINRSPWYTGNANLSFYSLQFLYVLVLVLHVFLFLINTARLSCFLDFKVYRRCHLFYKRSDLIIFDQILQFLKYTFTNFFLILQSEQTIQIFSIDCYSEPNCVFKFY